MQPNYQTFKRAAEGTGRQSALFPWSCLVVGGLLGFSLPSSQRFLFGVCLAALSFRHVVVEKLVSRLILLCYMRSVGYLLCKLFDCACFSKFIMACDGFALHLGSSKAKV